MAKSFEKKVIVQKIETTEGTDAGPLVTADAILTRNYTPNVLDTDVKTRELDLAYFGARPQALTGFRRGATFEIDLAGSGAVATPAPWMVVNRIAGFDAGVVTASTKVTQSPISTVIPSATHWGYIDNAILKTVGSRATMGIRVADDEFPFFTYTLLGRAPTLLLEEAVPGAPTLSAFKDPVIACTENTTFQLDSFALGLRSLEIDMNVENVFRSLIGPADRMAFRNRAASVRIVGELPDLTTKNYFSGIRNGGTMPLSLIHGVTAGNIVEVTAPKLQITGIDIQNEDGIAMLAIDAILQPSSGNDEISLVSR